MKTLTKKNYSFSIKYISLSFLCILCFSFKKKEQQNQNWSYIHSFTVNDSLALFSADTLYQINHYLLKRIKTRSFHTKIDSLGNKTERRYDDIKSIEVINIETDSVYIFSIQNGDTTLSNTKIYSSKELQFGFDINQLKDIPHKIASNDFVMNSKKDTILNLYTLNLANRDYSMTLLINSNIQSPYNISIQDENKNTINGALTEVQNHSANVVSKDKFDYIPSVPHDKIMLFERLKFIANKNSLNISISTL
ncbi:hypothetical protein [Sphingobacterium hungaricum]|uniref:Uncharacterized protein n=1 Tax=Sphingobacterium hungaricum TaxID=2082723 RepID=A0A928UX46_9SPHI|nr:hypothetical protein [Sphingobacterium hungaricum]MBE8712204.1 hypothetical protein [Sphingobacterium hungaricum]